MKSPKGLRIAQIILGGIAIGLSAAVIANPDVTTLFFVTLLGIALIMVGISKIIEGAIAKHVSKGSRFISLGIGVVSIAGGFFALVNPIAAVATIILIITIFILIHGIGLIANGAVSRSEGKASRIANIIIGDVDRVDVAGENVANGADDHVALFIDRNGIRALLDPPDDHFPQPQQVG